MNKFIFSFLLVVLALTSVGANLTNEKYVTNKVETAIQTVETKIVEKITTDTSLTNAAAVAAAKLYTDTEVAKKQDTITDLTTIRAGASAGATAVQPAAIADMETKTHAGETYQPKGSYITEETDPNVSLQDGTITIKGSSITPLTQHQSLSGLVTKEEGAAISNNVLTAAKGYTDTVVEGKQDTIEDLATIRSGAAAGATAVQPAAIADMETKTHAEATYQPKGSYLTSESDPNVTLKDGTITIKGSSITPLTQHQSLAAYDTRDQVNQKTNDVLVEAKAYADNAVSGKQDAISDLDTIRSGASAGATAVQPAAIADMETKTDAAAKFQPKGEYLPSNAVEIANGSITVKGTTITPITEHQSLAGYAKTVDMDEAIADAMRDVETDLTAAIVATNNALVTKINGGLATKQDTITDLSTIRSGAAAGATAVQPSTLNSYYTKTETDTQTAAFKSEFYATNTTVNTKIDSSVASTKTYAENKATTAENNAKAYADEKIPSTLNEFDTETGMTYTLNNWTYNYVTIVQSGATLKLPAPITDVSDKRSRIVMVVLDSSLEAPNIAWDWNGNSVITHEASPNDESPIKGRKMIHFIEVKRNTFMMQCVELQEL